MLEDGWRCSTSARSVRQASAAAASTRSIRSIESEEAAMETPDDAVVELEEGGVSSPPRWPVRDGWS